MPNRINQSAPPLPAGDLHEPEHHLLFKLTSAVKQFSIDTDRKVFGQFNVETDAPEGCNIFFQCYPGGDMYFWFVENGFYTVIALVDEKAKTLARLPVTELDKFGELVQSVAASLEMKHGYVPESFPAAMSSDENPPETTENK